MNVLITCADPLTMKSKLGESIIKQLLPKISIKNTDYAGKWPTTYSNLQTTLKSSDFQRFKELPDVAPHFSESAVKTYQGMLPLQDMLDNVYTYNIILDEYCPTSILKGKNSEVEDMNKELLQALNSLTVSTNDDKSYFITHDNYINLKNEQHPITKLLEDHFKLVTKKTITINKKKESWSVYEKKSLEDYGVPPSLEQDINLNSLMERYRLLKESEQEISPYYMGQTKNNGTVQGRKKHRRSIKQKPQKGNSRNKTQKGNSRNKTQKGNSRKK